MFHCKMKNVICVGGADSVEKLLVLCEDVEYGGFGLFCLLFNLLNCI